MAYVLDKRSTIAKKAIFFKLKAKIPHSVTHKGYLDLALGQTWLNFRAKREQLN